MNKWELPKALEVGGKSWEIRTDYRAILDIINGFDDPDFDDLDKWLTCLTILYVDFEQMAPSDYKEAAEKAREFIDMGEEPKENQKVKPRTMDWEQDASLIIPAVNKVIGHDVRGDEYMHWWTFLSAYMEIGECSYTHVLNIRNKKAKGKKLEKWEEEFYRNNIDLVKLKTKLSQEEIEEQALLEELFG